MHGDPMKRLDIPVEATTTRWAPAAAEWFLYKNRMRMNASDVGFDVLFIQSENQDCAHRLSTSTSIRTQDTDREQIVQIPDIVHFAACFHKRHSCS